MSTVWRSVYLFWYFSLSGTITSHWRFIVVWSHLVDRCRVYENRPHSEPQQWQRRLRFHDDVIWRRFRRCRWRRHVESCAVFSLRTTSMQTAKVKTAHYFVEKAWVQFEMLNRNRISLTTLGAFFLKLVATLASCIVTHMTHMVQL